MKTLCIVPCGMGKIWDKYPNAGPTIARYVYIGQFAVKCREYAETFYPASWCILSAKYGFLFPDDFVEANYNVTFSDLKTNPISLDTLAQQIAPKGLNCFDEITVVAGKNYVNVIKNLMPNLKIETPLSGCKGNGYMVKKMNEAIKQGKPIR